jgi:methionyl-tRNA formyltransferase
MKKSKKKIVFIGGLSNGKNVVSFIISKKNICIDLIFTHKKRNIPRYQCLNQFNKITKVIKTENINNYYSIIKKVKPDLILVAGWSGIINKKILEIPKYGVIGFHPSNLPKDRGRSVLAWQIEEGYKETALSMFFLTNKADAGDLIGKHKIVIKKNDYINDILDKIDSASIRLLEQYFDKLFSKKLKRKKQNLNNATYRKIRGYRNQLINWNKKGDDILNKIRAISKPYPGAIGVIKNKKYRIWEAKIFDLKKNKKNTLIKRCKDCSIEILNYEIIR